MINIGTSGYSYEDWEGNFYPNGIKKGDMLKFYSNYFNFTEINSTYYQMPSYFVFKNLDEKTPEGFVFSVKAYGGFTHSRDASKEDAEKFINALKPIIEKNKMSCLLFQFPYSFHKNDENLDYLKKMREIFKDQKLAIEFRNAAWARQETMEFLKENNLGWVCVDEPDIKGLVKPYIAVTTDTGYVRFHGRNSNKWYNHNEAYERYDYMYSEKELMEWKSRIEFVERHSKNILIAFNNHFRAQGAKNASMLGKILNSK